MLVLLEWYYLWIWNHYSILDGPKGTKMEVHIGNGLYSRTMSIFHWTVRMGYARSIWNSRVNIYAKNSYGRPFEAHSIVTDTNVNRSQRHAIEEKDIEENECIEILFLLYRIFRSFSWPSNHGWIIYISEVS